MTDVADNPDQAEQELRKKLEKEIVDAYHSGKWGIDGKPNDVIQRHTDNILALFAAQLERREAEATLKAYDLLFWKYKELNGQSVDRKFAEAYGALTEEALSKGGK